MNDRGQFVKPVTTVVTVQQKLRTQAEVTSALGWPHTAQYSALCSYRIKMDENGAQESHINFYAQFNSLKA